MDTWVSLVAGPVGALAALVIFLWGFKAGWWSTSLEVQAWRDRATRAETQVDTMLPVVEKTLVVVTEINEDQKETSRFIAVLMSFMDDQRRQQTERQSPSRTPRLPAAPSRGGS